MTEDLIAGIDECGTGAGAGPCFFGLAVVPANWADPRVKDSKKYSGSKKGTAHEKRSEVLREVIKPVALLLLTAGASAQLIDTVGSWKAQEMCMHRLVSECRSRFPGIRLIMDGENRDFGLNLECHNKADDLFPVVSAASILAKTTRDSLMHQLDRIYPGYDFKKSSGYLTPSHLEGLKTLGPSAIHRLSVVNGILGRT